MARFRAFIGLLIAALMLGPIILGILFYVAGGLQADVAASYSVENGVLRLTTFYYDIDIRLDGGFIERIVVRTGGGELVALDPDAGGRGVLLSVGKGRLLDSGIAWQVADSARLGDGSQVVVLKGEAEGVEITLSLTAYSWAPLLGINVEAHNPGGEPVTLESSVGGPMIVLAYSGQPAWRVSSLSIENGKPVYMEVSIEPGAPRRLAAETIVFIAEDAGEATLFYGVRGLRGSAEVYLNPEYPLEGDVRESVIAFGPGKVTLAPGEEEVIASYEVAIASFNLHNLVASGFLGEASVFYPDIQAPVKDYFPFDERIDELQDRVETLRGNLERLTRERDELQKQLREMQGKESLLNDKLEELEARVAELESQSKAARLLAPLAFIAGAVGGAVAILLARRG